MEGGGLCSGVNVSLLLSRKPRQFGEHFLVIPDERVMTAHEAAGLVDEQQLQAEDIHAIAVEIHGHFEFVEQRAFLGRITPPFSLAMVSESSPSKIVAFSLIVELAQAGAFASSDILPVALN